MEKILYILSPFSTWINILIILMYLMAKNEYFLDMFLCSWTRPINLLYTAFDITLYLLCPLLLSIFVCTCIQRSIFKKTCIK